MHIEQLYTACLAEMTYYIESNGEAVIIDPLRETEPYLELAKKRGAKITHIFLTHFHADFVSGHVDLANATGAKIVFGPNAETAFQFYQGADQEEFKIGDVTIKLLHTPGHTMESSVYLLLDENQKEHAIFTGDTLFIGDVGRPDLAVKTDLTEEDLAGYLYDSLQQKILPLPDDIIVYPAHGAGSACGKNMSSETYDTLGHQKETNYALRKDLTKEDFIKEVTEGLLPPPQYFPKNVLMNKGVNKSYDQIVDQGVTPLTVEEFTTLLSDEKALLLDVRSAEEFINEHIPNALFIGLDGGFAPWVGALITDLKTPIVLIVPEGREKEAVTRLSRVGYDNTIGFLNGGIEAWKEQGKKVESLSSVTATTMEAQLTETSNIIDVRKVSEHQAEHIEHQNVLNLPLDSLENNYHEIDTRKTYFLHCAGGYRSVIAISLLRKKGVRNELINIEGGFGAIKKCEHIKCADYSCTAAS